MVPSQWIPFQELFRVHPEKKRQRDGSLNKVPGNTTKLDTSVRQSAVTYFAIPMDASLSDRSAWKILTENDWHQVFTEARALSTAVSPSSSDGTWMPRIVAVTEMLDELKSHSYAEFAWSKLLTPLLAQCATSVGGLTQASALFAALLRHSSLAELSPSAFRDQLRARDLRQVGAAFGAQAELQLLQLFHAQRPTPKT